MEGGLGQANVHCDRCCAKETVDFCQLSYKVSAQGAE